MADRLEQRVRDAAPQPLAAPDAAGLWMRGRRLRRRRRQVSGVVGTLAVVAVAAAMVVAGVFDTGRTDVVIADAEQPDAPATTPGPEQVAPEPREAPPDPGAIEGEDGEEDHAVDTRPVTVYFARLGHQISVEPEVHEIDATIEAVAGAAMEILVSGDTRNPDLESLAPADTRVLATNIRDRVLIVDVSGELRARGGGSLEEGALGQQLAHTGASFANIDAVQLFIEGEPIDELWGHFDWSEPIAPHPLALSPITIDEPDHGDTVPAGEVVVSGEATVFEGEFLVRLYGPDGTLVDESMVMATSGGPGRGTWEHTFQISEPGRYTIEAEEEDIAPGEGFPPFTTRVVLDVEDP